MSETTIVVCVAAASVDEPWEPSRFEAWLEAVLDELDEGAAVDADLTAGLTEGWAEFMLTVPADDELDAAARGLAMVRSAIHAQRGRTPGWSGRARLRAVEVLADETVPA